MPNAADWNAAARILALATTGCQAFSQAGCYIGQFRPRRPNSPALRPRSDGFDIFPIGRVHTPWPPRRREHRILPPLTVTTLSDDLT